uniref:Cathepsin propeptide inhibitor domain-containing protein n=1 Tax=Pseudo-nitzschia australis TaxID=44445 RepID=A0A7S4EGC2_9STRA|mmetsp:Transcript_20299/g.44179  ORF Transcript_20299/g.44179 Transcript_20299/m.44179 type:complete len:328 (-) Transcript_20299:292-1275(-)|eukprot:CAMPEP_0168169162 /NCGR_PEP_ID=MMETSP0139_2-20121125/3494_1 /TAXON_ID=44445 /ORGANISM="Pseudo-nitzschia australis, Strain 10249 10 AB" /LENGTH=327 /DNA_ID=CAMNT_0008086569 /DNA_START=67 /DNA_END=1050 /DNA_ORIENTATION=-
MKNLVGATAIFVAMEGVSAYIEESRARRKSSPFAATDWSPQSFAPKIRIHPLGEPAIEEDKINIDTNADGIIRREYSAWTQRHGKVKDEKRFEIFRKNFILQMEMNRKNGQFFLLNEFGDLTKDEYIFMLKSSQESKIKDQNEVESAGPSSTLPPAPIPRLEDLTKDLLDSVMESSRKVVAEEQKEIIEADRRNTIFPQFRSSTAGKQCEVTAAEQASNPEVLESTPTIKSYFDVLNAPMQPLDYFIPRPTLMSAALTSVSETFKSHLINEVESKWGEYTQWQEHAFAMDFGNYYETYNYENSEDYVVYPEKESEVYGGVGEYSGWF